MTFKSVCRQLSVSYTLFRADGTPIRALAHITLLQTEKTVNAPRRGNRTPGQNPTLAAIGGQRARLVRDGDSLQSIAYEAYGDPGLWRPIAEANGIDRPVARAPRFGPRDPEARRLMAAISDRVATLTVKIDGQPLEERYAQRVVEVRVDDHRYLPDAFLIRITDPRRSRTRSTASRARCGSARRSRSRCRRPMSSASRC